MNRECGVDGIPWILKKLWGKGIEWRVSHDERGRFGMINGDNGLNSGAVFYCILNVFLSIFDLLLLEIVQRFPGHEK